MHKIARSFLFLIALFVVGEAFAPMTAEAQHYRHRRHYRHHRPYRHR